MTAELHDIVKRALAGDPRQPAMEFEGEIVDWGYLKKVADQLDAELNAAGLGPAAPIGVAPRNRPAFAAALLALFAGRRSIIMVYAFQSPQALAADLKRLELPAVIADLGDWNETTLGALDPATLAIGLASDRGDPQPVKRLSGDPAADRGHLRPTPDEPVLEMLTSGTTGLPKRTPTRYDMLAAGVIHGSVLDGGGGSEDVDQAPKPAGDPGTVNFPFSNISGIYSYLPMAVERRLVLLQEKFDLGRWIDFVKRHRPKVAVLPPAGVRMMVDADLPPDTLAGVEYITAGTTAIDPVAHAEFEKRFGVTILLSYGATEFAGAATAMTADLHARFGKDKFGSVGRPSGRNEVRIVDPADPSRQLPAGEVGIIEVKVPQLGEDFIRTTDLGLLDEDGFLFHRGRADGVIIRGGFKIMPATVEKALNSYPGVSASCVVGAPDARLGQVPVAVLEMKPGMAPADPAALEAHLREQLLATNIPVAFVVLPELPRTQSMKIDLKEVRALAARLREGEAATVG